jgi:hypothetical protein
VYAVLEDGTTDKRLFVDPKRNAEVLVIELNAVHHSLELTVLQATKCMLWLAFRIGY